MVWGYECLKLSKEYPRVGVNAQLLKITIPAGAAHLLARHEARQLCGLLSADVHHDYVPSRGVLCLSGHGLGPLCGHLPLHYPSIITEQFVISAAIFIIFCNLLATLPTPILAARLSYCASNIVGNCICASISIANVCCGGIHLSKLYQLVRVWCLLGSDLALILLSYCFILRKWQT